MTYTCERLPPLLRGPAYNHCAFLLSYAAWLVVCCTLCRCFSWAISWLFFKWPLSQGMAGQHMETSALTIFLSKQQMALLLSFWSGAKIPKAEVLVYTECLEQNCLGVWIPYSSMLTDVWSLTLISSLFLPMTPFAGYRELWFFLLWLLLMHCPLSNYCPLVSSICGAGVTTSVTNRRQQNAYVGYLFRCWFI